MKKLTADEQIGCVLPIHQELKVGTLSGIFRQSQVNPEYFIDRL